MGAATGRAHFVYHRSMQHRLSRFTRFTLVFTVLFACVSVLTSFGVLRATESVSQSYEISDAPDPVLSAHSWMVFDLSTGEELFSHRPDTQLPIASITKLMSAAVFYEGNDMTMTTSITWADVAAEGRAGKLHYGDTYTYRELLFPLLLESSNDAAATIERVDADVVNRMNELTDFLPLTILDDASGLSDKNRSTASELRTFIRFIHQDMPHILDITRLKEYYAADNGWLNNSPFIDDPTYRGGKHGFTNAANRTAVALFSEELSSDNARTLGYVVLGSDDLASDMRELRNFVSHNVRYR